MKCPSCQQTLANDAQFCGGCGMSTADHNASPTQAFFPQGTNHENAVGTPSHDPRLGLILDSKYKLVAHLGEGGMGSVYRAQRLHIGDEVAVKLLHHDLVREEHAIERFRREARSAAMIQHQNVVSIHDFSDAGGDLGEAYIVMELVKGESLRQLLQREGRMSPMRAVALMRDICAGVGVAHRQGLLHRDLKPDNVIVTPPDHEGGHEAAKVVDFGLAKVRDVTAVTALTHAGTVMGTLYYMSPEQCADEKLDATADVYSLGAMFYEMLAGYPPFRSGNIAGLIAKHLNEPPPPFPDQLQIPPALSATCLRALSKHRDLRQQDAIALGRELEAALSGGPLPLSEARTLRAEPIASTGQSRQAANPIKWAIIGTATVLAVVLLIGTGIAIKYGVDRLMRQEADVSNNSEEQAATGSGSAEVAQTGTDGRSTSNLQGTWTGTYGTFGNPAKLIIEKQKGNQLDGVLEQGPVRVAFSGTVDSTSRAVRMKQSKVLSGDGWSLGEDTGTISADGRKMSGTGKDPMGGALGISYQWSFSRP